MKSKQNRLIMIIFAVITVITILSVAAAAKDSSALAAQTSETAAEISTEKTTHAEEQIIIENEKDSGLFFNEPITTTPETPKPSDEVPTGAVAAPLAAAAVTAVSGILAVMLRRRKNR